MSGQVLAETPFEVTSRFPLLGLLFKALLGAAALASGALFRAAVHRWRGRKPDGEGDPPPDVRVEPHTMPVEVATEPVPDGTRTVTVRLEPHPDSGTQRLQEVDR